MTNKQSKRIQRKILSITVKRMFDDSPDSSWLGKYSRSAETEYAIDRAHAEDCASLTENHFAAVEKLERIITLLGKERTAEGNNPQSTEWEPLDECLDVLTGLQDQAMECDCSGGCVERGEFRYFNGCPENYQGEDPVEIRKYIRQDFDRMEAANRGDWCYLGIRVDAQVTLREENGRSIVQDITSGGLYGIESDSEASYFKSVAADEWSELKKELGALGFSKRALAVAWKNRMEKEEQS
jgi:hypothetical protein